MAYDFDFNFDGSEIKFGETTNNKMLINPSWG